MVVTARSNALTALCPLCGAASERVQSHYVRQPSDLPCAGRHVRLRLLVRRLGRDHLSKAEALAVAAVEAGVLGLADARSLVERFQAMIRTKAAAELNDWIEGSVRPRASGRDLAGRGADGAYDGAPTYQTVAMYGDGIEVVIPPRSTANAPGLSLPCRSKPACCSLSCKIKSAIAAQHPPVQLLVIEANGIIEIDYTGAQILRRVVTELRATNIVVALARLSDERAQAHRTGLIETLGPCVHVSRGGGAQAGAGR